MKINQKSKLFLLLFSAVSSFLILMICTRSSFLYPMNNWVDAQCFFTVGKAMANGQIVYRDIFEQKGVLLYFLHMLTYFVSHTTFIGVFFLEVMAGTAFLFINIKILTLYTDIRFAVFSAVLCSMSVYSSMAFCEGDSAEELCLPLLAYALYLSTKAFKNGKWLTGKQLFCVGIVSACVLWIKYTMLGFFIGWIIVPLLWLIKEKQWKAIGKTFLYIILGVFVVTLPIILYFAVNHALSDLWEVYFYKNIFGYSHIDKDLSLPQKIVVIIQKTAMLTKYAFLNNLQRFTGLLLIGLIGFLFMKGKKQKLSIYIMFLTSTLFIYGGGNVFDYYPLPLSVFSVFGCIPPYLLIRWIIRKKYRQNTWWKDFQNPIYTVITGIFTIVIALCLSVKFSYNIDFMKYQKEDTPQYRFKEIIQQETNPTLLQFGGLDGGFYSVCDIVPNCKYFCGLNINLPEIKEGQQQYLDNGEGMFVVVYAGELHHDNYELVATEKFDDSRMKGIYNLYRLKSIVKKE